MKVRGRSGICPRMDLHFRERIERATRRAFEGRGVLVAYAFGSRVGGHPLPGSDLDLGYYLEEYRTQRALPLREEMALSADLSDELGVEVDLRSMAGAPLELRGRALEEGVRVYSGDEAARVALEVYVLARYHDTKEGLRRLHERRLARTAAGGL